MKPDQDKKVEAPAVNPSKESKVVNAQTDTKSTENLETGKTKKAKSGNGNGNGKSKTESSPMMSEAQKSAVYNLSRRRGISVDELEKLCQEKFGVSVEELSSVNAASFIRNLQQSA